MDLKLNPSSLCQLASPWNKKTVAGQDSYAVKRIKNNGSNCDLIFSRKQKRGVAGLRILSFICMPLTSEDWAWIMDWVWKWVTYKKNINWIDNASSKVGDVQSPRDKLENEVFQPHKAIVLSRLSWGVWKSWNYTDRFAEGTRPRESKRWLRYFWNSLVRLIACKRRRAQFFFQNDIFSSSFFLSEFWCSMIKGMQFFSVISLGHVYSPPTKILTVSNALWKTFKHNWGMIDSSRLKLGQCRFVSLS